MVDVFIYKIVNFERANYMKVYCIASNFRGVQILLISTFETICGEYLQLQKIKRPQFRLGLI